MALKLECDILCRDIMWCRYHWLTADSRSFRVFSLILVHLNSSRAQRPVGYAVQLRVCLTLNQMVWFHLISWITGENQCCSRVQRHKFSAASVFYFSQSGEYFWYLCVLGHGLWIKNLKDPVFQVDMELSPALAGFYVFWTMIIVLQVLFTFP